ncbi:hypothetical protein MMC28_011029, partial [Mycoblastus sanguinarius]|nr:hypothetical protein [Mycoblastus sanguinarius]
MTSSTDKDLALVSSEERAQGSLSSLEQETSPKANSWWKFGGRDRIFVPSRLQGSKSTFKDFQGDRTIDDDNNADGNVFSDPRAVELYKPIEKYEGRHRFDLHATWSDEEEKRLVRRLDWKICLWACIMFFALQLDRGNITQALSDNMLADLGLNTNDYNNGMTIFYCCFLFAELPSQLVSKKIGPDNWIPVQMLAWSCVASSQSHLSGRTTFFVTRALLGLLEGGFIPDVVLYLSYFYKNSELPVRLAYFWTSLITTNIIASFLAYGILHLRGHNGMAGWRWLFAIEGGVSALIGILSWLYLPPSPTQTKRTGLKGLLRNKNGWFTEREEVIMVNRILRDDPGKATMHNRQAISFTLLWESLTDYDMWPIYLIGLTWTIPMTPETNYLTLTLRSLGFDTFQTSLLTIPSNVLFIIQLLFWTWLSERTNQRFFVGLVSQLWAIPLIVALETLPIKFAHANWVRYSISSLIVGYPYAHATLVAVTSRNAASVRTRTVGSSLYNMAVQLSNIISSQIYRSNDKPLYRRGNKILLGLAAYNAVLFIATKFYYVWRNSKRDRTWDRMSQDQRLEYLATTNDKGNKR